MNSTKGIYLALITASISGIAIFVNKFAVMTIQPPLVFTAIKNAGVGLLILAILFAGRKWKLVKKLNKREIIYLITIGVIGGAIPFYLYFTGLTQIPAVNAAIIHKSLVIWVALIAIPFLKESMSALQMFAVVLLFGTNLLVGGFQGFTFLEGEFLVLIATIFWAIENVLAKKILPTVDPDIVTAARMGFGSLILLAAAAITAPIALTNTLALTSTQWLFMIITIATLLGYTMSWYRALKYAPATTVTSVLVASTLMTNVLSAIFVTHTWTVLMGIQAILMIIGIALFLFLTKKAPNTALSNT